MTVNDYIQQKFQTFNIQLSEADLLEISLASGIKGEGEINEDTISRVLCGVAKFIPSLLLRATSSGESGFSVSWNIQGIKDYYSYLCSEYNLPNKLGSKIIIHDIADFL